MSKKPKIYLKNKIDQSTMDKIHADSKIESPRQKIAPSKVLAVVFALVLIVGIPIGVTKFFYHADSQTDISRSMAEDKAKLEKLESQKNELVTKINKENADFGFNSTLDNYKTNKSPESKWQVAWQTNFGNINIELESKDAPASVENFIRLNSRQYYNNSIVHRIVKSDNFKVIQGGDFTKYDGTGGQSAYYISEQLDNLIPDENWKVKPESNLGTGESSGGVPANDSFYKNFDTKTGEIEYPKGLILMAKKNYPDSASSQFFITLDKTILPAQYTVFGKITEDTLNTLDKINTEVSVGEGSKTPKDGIPDRQIMITNTEIKKV
jgi:peptidyl-prolyl cis-trans isomerase B (cyclophilin B)